MNIFVKKSVYLSLCELSQKLHLSMSQIVDEALREYVKHHELNEKNDELATDMKDYFEREMRELKNKMRDAERNIERQNQQQTIEIKKRVIEL